MIGWGINSSSVGLSRVDKSSKGFDLRTSIVFAIWLAVGVFTALELTAAEPAPRPSSKLPDKLTDSPLLNSRFVMFGSKQLRRQTLRWAARRGEPDMVASLIYALRYLRPAQREAVVETLEKLTKRRYGDDWFRWMQWQQQHPEVVPFEGFDVFLSALFNTLDPKFKRFIYPGVSHRIRLEEIVWGGVSKDGIPALNNPKMIAAQEASYLAANEAVFGVSINGEARAYPYRIMDWHEMVNDEVGGQTIALAYCTLCGSAILFDTSNENGGAFQFGSSGLLYRSNKLMYDEGTHSLWNQFTGRPVVGRLAESGIQLDMLPIVTTTWAAWRKRNPATLVLSADTGFSRDYRPNRAYGEYFKSSRLMFPANTDARQLGQKDVVFGLRVSGAAKSWPLDRFESKRLIHDTVGALQLVLIGDAESRTVRAYRGDGLVFSTTEDEAVLRADGATWRVTEAALIASDGRALTRLPGHLAYWFAWHNYLGSGTLAE